MRAAVLRASVFEHFLERGAAVGGDDCGQQLRLQLTAHEQEAAAATAQHPLVAVGDVVVGGQILHVNFDLTEGVSAVDEDAAAAACGSSADVLHRQDDGGHRGDVGNLLKWLHEG